MTTTDQNTTDTTAQGPENGTQTAETTTTPPDASEAAQGAPHGEPETFPREYVEKLRKEAAEARQKAKRAGDYARALFAARVAATGRLADPSDLPFDPELVDDLPAMEAAIGALLEAHPHYASRTPQGDIGQGATTTADTVDLAGILRARA